MNIFDALPQNESWVLYPKSLCDRTDDSPYLYTYCITRHVSPLEASDRLASGS